MTREADRSTPAHGRTNGRAGSSAPFVLRGDGVSIRVRTWSFSDDVAHAVLLNPPRVPSIADIDRWCQQLADRGYRRMRTGALGTAAGLRVEQAGFHAAQELLLLEHVAPGSIAGPRLHTTRMRTSGRAGASSVDQAAFPEGWRLDAAAIADVCDATPHHRARIAGIVDGTPAAYAVTGRDARQGFLQRLAVRPEQQRQGLGRALVADSLRWLGRRRVHRVLVNTPVDNDAAIELYEGMGFDRLPEHLYVYERSLV
ncbi:MAG TPA: GNAT family N-acetyltransferase [Ilumatobacteraceae bacterium]|nr:GNAT family N-acetyltransferase [Ilumatobacteraceae bacterium]